MWVVFDVGIQVGGDSGQVGGAQEGAKGPPGLSVVASSGCCAESSWRGEPRGRSMVNRGGGRGFDGAHRGATHGTFTVGLPWSGLPSSSPGFLSPSIPASWCFPPTVVCMESGIVGFKVQGGRRHPMCNQVRRLRLRVY